MNILIGVTGSIAAYKAYDIARALKKDGHCVRCMLSPGGEKFINKLTMESLLLEEVLYDMWDENSDDKRSIHIRTAEWADLIAVVPASADFMARIAYGMADCVLSATVLAAVCKKLIAPAMHTNMWQNPITQDNVSRLIQFDFEFMDNLFKIILSI